MNTTSLDTLLEEDGVTTNLTGLVVRIQSSWIVPGEDRLSYTTLTRLVECCREHHWNTDVIPKSDGVPVDSTIKSLTATFVTPIKIGSVISITYQVTYVREKGYSLRFNVNNMADRSLCAAFELVSIFYDSAAQRVVVPPRPVLDHLAQICVQESKG